MLCFLSLWLVHKDRSEMIFFNVNLQIPDFRFEGSIWFFPLPLNWETWIFPFSKGLLRKSGLSMLASAPLAPWPDPAATGLDRATAQLRNLISCFPTTKFLWCYFCEHVNLHWEITFLSFSRSKKPGTTEPPCASAKCRCPVTPPRGSSSRTGPSRACARTPTSSETRWSSGSRSTSRSGSSGRHVWPSLSGAGVSQSLFAYWEENVVVISEYSSHELRLKIVFPLSVKHL